MSKTRIHAACMGLMLMGSAALPLHALARDPQAAATAITASHDVTVVLDAGTGNLRAPTTDEQAVMETAKAARALNFRVAPRPTLQRYHASGARGARLTDDFMSTSIAVIQADGSLEKQCFESHDAAVAAMTAAMTAAGTRAPLTLETE
jgi:hypothetical protein